MRSKPVPKKRLSGRPSNAMAGEVDERLLDAATRVFLERGLGGSTFDLIAEAAHAGKATVYARYANKEELFVAVIRRAIDRTMGQPFDSSADKIPMPRRLAMTAQGILENALSAEVLALVRVVITEGPRFPALAVQLDDYGRRQAIARADQIIRGRQRMNSKPADVSQIEPCEAAKRFIEMVIPPMLLRALTGGDLTNLRREIPEQIAGAIALLQAAGLIDASVQPET